MAKIIIEIDTDEDEEIMALIMRLIELVEKSRPAGKGTGLPLVARATVVRRHPERGEQS